MEVVNWPINCNGLILLILLILFNWVLHQYFWASEGYWGSVLMILGSWRLQKVNFQTQFRGTGCMYLFVNLWGSVESVSSQKKVWTWFQDYFRHARRRIGATTWKMKWAHTFVIIYKTCNLAASTHIIRARNLSPAKSGPSQAGDNLVPCWRSLWSDSLLREGGFSIFEVGSLGLEQKGLLLHIGSSPVDQFRRLVKDPRLLETIPANFPSLTRLHCCQLKGPLTLNFAERHMSWKILPAKSPNPA
jgi:hypothetical protein